ncbi:MAG: amidohydrolase [Prevotellaceae bacterium]|jgi:predicted amidohydrolase|nr:amidohydrolase [Prevotellaceae bacterium]
MQSELTVSLIQYDIAWENANINLSKLEKFFEKIPENTDLIILPEMFTSGFTMAPFHVAETMHGNTVTWMREKAIALKKAITGSIIIKEGDKYYNRLIFATPNGMLHYYDKRHLFSHSGENEHYTAGKKRLIVDYLGWRICPLICYDLRFPVWSANRNDYDLLIYVANWPQKRHNVWEILPYARAIENQCYAAVVNRINDDNQGYPHSGFSRTIDYNGKIINVASTNHEEIITSTLSFEKLHEFRKKFDFIADADPFGIFL